MRAAAIVATSAILALSAGCFGGAPDGTSSEDTGMGNTESKTGGTFQISSTAFSEGAPIPRKFTCQGDDVSPALEITGAPDDATTLAVIVHDPDAPPGDWDHWLFWNLPVDSATIPENADVKALGARIGKNTWGNSEYGGPCPPSGTHRYFFRAYALDRPLDLAAGSDRAALEAEMDRHLLAEASLMGTYEKT